jgi:3-oxoacyl-[acyl-carrier protein] reductase
MIRKHWGRVINISSVVGESGNRGQVAYSSAKAGMIGMTKSLALELASRQITVNAVTPGWIATDMTKRQMDMAKEKVEAEIPLGFVGEAIDIANSVVFLSSPSSRYITGHVLAVNGGLYM